MHVTLPNDPAEVVTRRVPLRDSSSFHEGAVPPAAALTLKPVGSSSMQQNPVVLREPQPASATRGRGKYRKNMQMKGRYRPVVTAALECPDDTYTVLKKHGRGTTKQSRNNALANLFLMLVRQDETLLSMLVREDVESCSHLRSVPAVIIAQCVVAGKLLPDAARSVESAMGAPAPQSVNDLLCAELQFVFKQVEKMAKGLDAKFQSTLRAEMNLSGTSLEGMQTMFASIGR